MLEVQIYIIAALMKNAGSTDLLYYSAKEEEEKAFQWTE